jgi:NNP family nitrate/nitrite transporter-like MFS transporter
MKAESIKVLSFKKPHMRVFHLTWITFFLCFFGWFGLAPLMAVIREDLSLTKNQMGNIMIASVSITIFARLLFGWLCDKIGPRLSYTYLLALGSIPVMAIGLCDSYLTFLLCRLAIGAIGASFVITQYHTSVMFAPNVVGTANATVAGWGNLGGGITQMVMPLIFSLFIFFGFSDHLSWRLSMIVPGLALMLMAYVYYHYTTDTPDGNIEELRQTNPAYRAKAKEADGAFWTSLKDYRVWTLFLCYGACFGIEITIDNIAALYFIDNFKLGLKEAGLIAGTFGFMNLFARALGGYFSDKVNKNYGFHSRIVLLAAFLALEGFGIMFFSSTSILPIAIGSMLGFALFVKMSNGVTYSIVPFVNSQAIGSVSGIVGAGGNLGAVIMGFVLKMEDSTHSQGLYLIGAGVVAVALISLSLLFSNWNNLNKRVINTEINDTKLVL